MSYLSSLLHHVVLIENLMLLAGYAIYWLYVLFDVGIRIQPDTSAGHARLRLSSTRLVIGVT